MAFDITGLGAIFDFGSKLVDRLIPDPAQKLAAQQELMKMAMEKELAVMANDTALIKAQTDINAVQASSDNLFVSGPRPALMWVGVAGVAYQWLLVRNLKNLMLQPWDGEGGAKKKDRLEKRLQQLVCSKQLGLRDAQAAVYGDWKAAYRRYVPGQ